MYCRICFAEFIDEIHLELAIGAPRDYVLFKLSVLSHFLERFAIRDMKFGQIVERIVFTRGASIADIKEHAPILIGQGPVGQTLNVANIVNRNTFDALKRPIEIILGKPIYRVPG